MKKGSIQIGTSGWNYKHWKGIYYPDGLAETKWLSFYAETFHITEINTSFYHLPKPATVKNWVEKVPVDFSFCPKISRYLTHMKKLNDPEEPVQRFFDVFTAMYDRMGPVLVQLPPSLKFHEEKATHFFNLLKTQYADFSFALEVRHASWLDERPVELMGDFNIAFVISQSKDKFPYAEHVTAKEVYVRFHGPRELYASSYSDQELHYYATLFLKWKNEGRRVFAFFNNDIHGYAFQDAKRLMDMCADGK